MDWQERPVGPIHDQGSEGDFREMNSVQRLTLSVLGVAAATFLVGCGTSTKEVETTTYVPAPPAQIVVQTAPVPVAPPAPTTTSSTSSDRSTTSTDSGNAGAMDSSISHHSESTTVTPSN